MKLGIGAFPVYSSSVQGGIEPGGSGVYISNKVPALQQAAAWSTSPTSATRRARRPGRPGTGYIPVRKSSAQTATVQHLWATNPGYKVAYNEINNGVNSPATSGSVIGPYADVRTDVAQRGDLHVHRGRVAGQRGQDRRVRTSTSTISSYNSRLGC